MLSIGTNSTRMLVAAMRSGEPHVHLARTIGTRIGEGLGDEGALEEEPMERTLSALREYARESRDCSADIVVVATSALRRATNATDFFARVEGATGKPLRVLSGEEEARASFCGATASLPAVVGRTGVIDVGGGSTEYAIGEGTQPEWMRSCEIGAVRLTELLPVLAGESGHVGAEVLDRARDIARTALEPMREAPMIERLLVVGGSVTTAAAVAGVAERHPPVLTQHALQKTLERLCALDLDDRKSVPGMRPQRADILPAGVVVLSCAMEIARQDRAIVAPGDLLLGVFFEEHARGKKGREPKKAL